MINIPKKSHIKPEKIRANKKKQTAQQPKHTEQHAQYSLGACYALITLNIDRD